jgi:hypothetical protein
MISNTSMIDSFHSPFRPKINLSKIKAFQCNLPNGLKCGIRILQYALRDILIQMEILCNQVPISAFSWETGREKSFPQDISRRFQKNLDCSRTFEWLISLLSRAFFVARKSCIYVLLTSVTMKTYIQ